MRIFIGLLTAALASSVFALEPPPAATPTSQPAREPAATADSSAPAKPAAADTKSDVAPKLVLTAADSEAADQLKRLKAAGYKPEVHGSEVWFCRKEAPMGSRLEKKICNTADQLIHQEADARQATDHIQRRISGDPIQPGALCCGHRQ